jgi:Ca-activated chloride channel family protein
MLRPHDPSPGPPVRIPFALALLAALAALAATGALPGARAQEHELPRTPVDPDSIGTGALLWRAPEGLIPLPVLATDVDLQVTGILVRGRLTQRFHNVTGELIEAVYMFPLPEEAAVHRMEMRIGSRVIKAIVQERAEAKRTYVQARNEGRKAALVEQERPNLFTTSAANIEPGETIEVVLEYVDEVAWRDGEFGLRFPLTFTPRYSPAESVPEQVSCAPFVATAEAPSARVRVRIDAGVDLSDVISRTHSIDTFLDGDTWDVVPSDETIPADRDFELGWKPLVEDRPEAALFVEDRTDGRYGMLMLVPPETGTADWGLPTETLFVVDRSGSMAGPSIHQAREALLAALDRLRPEDAFDILAFDNEIHPFADGFRPATADNLERAREWIRRLDSGGGTEIFPALLEAIARTSRSESDRVQRIVFMTDGAVSNEQALFDRIAAGLGRARLHTVGIGHAPNGYLMRKMASFGRGVCELLAVGSDTDNRIAAFLERIDRPVMSDVTLHWEGVTPEETYPARLPDLYPGKPLLVSFKLSDGPGGGVLPASFAPASVTAPRVTLNGRLRDGPLSERIDVPRPAAVRSGVALRWARAKVGMLMDSLHEGADGAMVRREVVAVGLAFQLVTRYTSLVAVEEFISTAGNAARARVANALPAGSELGVLPRGGTLQPLFRRLALAVLLAGLLVWCFTFRPDGA